MNPKLEDRLKKNKLRLTAARQNVFQVLSRSNKALSAQEVLEKINASRKVSADQASVYRNLTLFHDIGLVHRFQNGKYSLCKQEHEHGHEHMHIMANCTQCGSTVEIESHTQDLCQLANSMSKHLASFGQFSGITFQGICRQCS